MPTSSFHVDGGGRFDVFFIGTSFLRKALGHRRKGLRIWNNKKKSNTALMGPDVGQKHSPPFKLQIHFLSVSLGPDPSSIAALPEIGLIAAAAALQRSASNRDHSGSLQRSESNRNHRGSDGFAASLPATARTAQHEIVHAELIDRIDSLRFLFP
ncbi:hypothetical protein L2E82_29981 [Cichorium intybus]|uniref:Uncharacterized protein n=1 Tax=Cichorium intybus TaxID=13427 RepID=A0ACB9CZR6_CICIN|nr:hypothetical protein L2E82_29981 [Cichorium intybus]